MAAKRRIAVIGVGYIGERHLVGMAADGRAEVVAIADVKPDLLVERQRAFGVPRIYADYHELLEKEELDGVVVATPDELHRGPAVAVAAMGKPLFLEKPIATTTADAEAIVRAVEQSGKPCLINFGLRLHKPYAMAKARFAAGEMGVPVTAYAKRVCDLDEAWRLHGRCTVNEYLGVHDIDYLIHVFGRDVKSIYSVKSEFRVYEKLKTADHYWNVITWKNGASATVLASWAGPLGAQVVVDNEVLIFGTHGSVQVAERWAKQEGAESWTVNRFATETGYEEPLTSGWDSMDSHFLDVIQGLAEPVATVYDGLNATRLVIAGEESARTGQAVDVELVDK